jgi:hypothetical protein
MIQNKASETKKVLNLFSLKFVWAWVTVFVSLALAVAWFYSSNKQPHLLMKSEKPSNSIESSIEFQKRTQASKNLTKGNTVLLDRQESDPSKHLEGSHVDFGFFSAPTLETYRNEVQRNVHETPASLKQMAIQVGQVREVLAKSSKNALNQDPVLSDQEVTRLKEQLLMQLKNCSQSEAIASVPREFCRESLTELETQGNP